MCFYFDPEAAALYDTISLPNINLYQFNLNKISNN